MTNKPSRNNKLNNKENKKNDINRPKGDGGNREIPPVFENFHGVPIE